MSEFFYTAINKLINNENNNIKIKSILSILCYATEFENNISLKKIKKIQSKKISKHLEYTINNK